jgi:hypothetical protein
VTDLQLLSSLCTSAGLGSPVYKCQCVCAASNKLELDTPSLRRPENRYTLVLLCGSLRVHATVRLQGSGLALQVVCAIVRATTCIPVNTDIQCGFAAQTPYPRASLPPSQQIRGRREYCLPSVTRYRMSGRRLVQKTFPSGMSSCAPDMSAELWGRHRGASQNHRLAYVPGVSQDAVLGLTADAVDEWT